MRTTFGTQESPHQRRPVAWYAPGVLWQAGREWVQSADFQRNLDRRETFGDQAIPIDFSSSPCDEATPFWFDLMSDTGDGGDATFSVAQALLRHELVLTDPDSGAALRLPEGELLVLGGDLAYPGASAESYQYRFIEMMALARDPASRFVSMGEGDENAPRKTLLAIPQNHDWFDSASTFCRYFVNYNKGAVAGASTPQRQTWFATCLPGGFWILGLDFALTGDLDRPQLEAFLGLLGTGGGPRIQPGDQVLLLYPEPYWSRPLGDGAAPGYPKRYQRLESALEAHGAVIRLRVAGDLHHYHRERLEADPLTGLDSHLVTCGTGGAFAHPTHCDDVQAPKLLDRSDEPHAVTADLHQRVRVGRVSRAEAARSPLPHFKPAATWPRPEHTRRLAWRNVLALLSVRFSRPLREMSWTDQLSEVWTSNLGFALCLGLLYAFNAYVNSGVFSASFRPDGFGPMATLRYDAAALLWLKAMVFSPFAAFVNLGMLAACLRTAWEGPGHWLGRLISGFAHGMAHGFLVFSLYWLSCVGLVHLGLQALGPVGPWVPQPLHATLAALATWLSVGLAGVLAGGLLFGSYLALMCGGFRQLPNNAFGSLAIQDYKGFLRCKLTPSGLHIYMLGLDKVPARHSTQEPLPSGWRIVDQFHIAFQRRR